MMLSYIFHRLIQSNNFQRFVQYCEKYKVNAVVVISLIIIVPYLHRNSSNYVFPRNACFIHYHNPVSLSNRVKKKKAHDDAK